MHGISIQHITLPNLKIENLYLKLDKKITLSADKIIYTRASRAKASIYEIDKIISYFIYLDPVFTSISLKQVIYNNEKVHLLYRDDIFYINSKFLTLDAKISQKRDKTIDMSVKQMILKDYQLELKGSLVLNLKKKAYDFRGKFSILNIDGDIKLKIDEDMLYYSLKTDKFKTLAPIMKYIKSKVFIEPIARDWIYKKIVANEYKLTSLSGKYDLKRGDFFPNSIKATAITKGVTIKFHPKITAAHTSKINLKLENNNLYFYLTKPTYEKKNLKIKDIHIYNILTTKNGIIVSIDSDTLLDRYVHNILKTFGINIPITQQDGKNNSNITLDIRFKPYSVKAKGVFKIKNSHFKLLGIPFYTKHTEIKLNNYKVYLKDANLVYKKIFDIDTTGLFRTKQGKYSGRADINSLTIKLKKYPLLNISNLKNQPVILKISRDKNSIFFSKLKTKLLFEKNKNQFFIDDISIYKNYSDFIKESKIKKGSIIVRTKRFRNYSANLKLFDLKTPFTHNKKRVKDFDINITTDGRVVKANANHGKFSISYDKHLILDIKDIDILVENNSSKKDTKIDMSLNGKNVNFILKDMNSTLLSDSFTMNRFKNETRFISLYKNSKLGFEQNRSRFSLFATNLSSDFIDTVLNTKMLKGGSFDLKGDGISSKMFSGVFHIKNSTFRDFSLFNNIMATINTIPSLVLLKDPNFNDKGYVVKNGTIKFRVNGGIISFSKITLHGVSADISGYGYINMDDKSINLELQIKTLKDVSKVIKNIPLIGYIILGDDKSISTNIVVNGSIKNPKVKTQILRDTIMSPLNIIKRTLEAPIKIFQ